MINIAWPWLFLLLPLPFVVRMLPAKKHQADGVLKVPFYNELVSLSLGGQSTVKSTLFDQWFFFFLLICCY